MGSRRSKCLFMNFEALDNRAKAHASVALALQKLSFIECRI
jgi:hypothetical protein